MIPPITWDSPRDPDLYGGDLSITENQEEYQRICREYDAWKRGVALNPSDDPHIQTQDRLQYIGEALGIIGAVLVALPSSLARAVGFGVWIVGDAAWIWYGRRAGNPHIARLFSVYFVTALIGFWGMLA